MNNFPLQDAAMHLAKQGRYGDSMLVHMNPIEVNAISKMSPTGQLTINPHTGQPEAFLPMLFSMMAPSLMGALGATAMSPLVASAIGTGLGTVAEGGSLQEGLSAGLMGGLTGGLLKGVTGGDLLGKVADPAVTGAVAAPDVSTLGKLTAATGGTPYDKSAGLFTKLKTGLGNIPESMGLTQGMMPPNAAGVALDAPLTQGAAFMGQTVPSLASGMVGEMYVPQDYGGLDDEESIYKYEGPYKPTEQRSMIGSADPFASAFGGEQQMLEGDVFPPGFNMRYGGLVKRLEKGGMPKAQQQIEATAESLEQLTPAQQERIMLLKMLGAQPVPRYAEGYRGGLTNQADLQKAAPMPQMGRERATVPYQPAVPAERRFGQGFVPEYPAEQLPSFGSFLGEQPNPEATVESGQQLTPAQLERLKLLRLLRAQPNMPQIGRGREAMEAQGGQSLQAQQAELTPAQLERLKLLRLLRAQPNMPQIGRERNLPNQYQTPIPEERYFGQRFVPEYPAEQLPSFGSLFEGSKDIELILDEAKEETRARKRKK